MRALLRSCFITFLLVTIQITTVRSQFTDAGARRGMVVSAHRLASTIGVDILKKGGNAVDAAVAVGFALAVVYPEAGNIGGGGFMLVRTATGVATVIDFREEAPGAAYQTMYLDESGRVTNETLDGHRAVAVPGTVAGLLMALEKYGTLSRSSVLQNAIALAREGFVVDQRLERSLTEYYSKFLRYPSTLHALTKGGNLYCKGDTLRQPHLAQTLERIRDHGVDGFYKGVTAQLIVDEMRRGGGIITREDLEKYRPIIRSPLTGSYRGYEIITTPLPSSGGICLIQLLNMIEGDDVHSLRPASAQFVHLIAESMKRVFADRSEFLGDPAFSTSPVASLLSKEYAAKRRAEVDPDCASPSASISHGNINTTEGMHTTHFSVVDSTGMSVAVTYTVNDLFGSKVVVDGAGFLLNDEMDDFSAKPGVPNVYGLVGGDRNAIQPGKRPLSSMAPTIVTKDGYAVMILGARGGGRIIPAIFLAIVNMIDFRMNVHQAVNFGRFTHQWLPDTLLYERNSLATDVLDDLRAKGHIVNETTGSVGQLEAIAIDPVTKDFSGGADARESGVVVGY